MDVGEGPADPETFRNDWWSRSLRRPGGWHARSVAAPSPDPDRRRVGVARLRRPPPIRARQGARSTEEKKEKL